MRREIDAGFCPRAIGGTCSRLVLGSGPPLKVHFGSSRRVTAQGETLGPLKAPYLAVIDGQLGGTWTNDTITLSRPGSLQLVIRDQPVRTTLSSSTEPLPESGTTRATTRCAVEQGHLAR